MSDARRERVRTLAAGGWSDVQIAAELGVNPRTVLRDRQRAGIASRYYELLDRLPIEHGTYAGYARGCHCDRCRAAYAAHMREYRDRTGRRPGRYEPCPTCGRRTRIVDGVIYAGYSARLQPHACAVTA